MTLCEGGYYYGKLIFPREFPVRPPSIPMIPVSVRFKRNTRQSLSIQDFHAHAGRPACSVPTVPARSGASGGEGSMGTSDFTKFNILFTKGKVFCESFPEIVEEIKPTQKAQDRQASSRPQTVPLYQRCVSRRETRGGLRRLSFSPALRPGLSGTSGGSWVVPWRPCVPVSFAAFAHRQNLKWTAKPQMCDPNLEKAKDTQPPL
ncbi:LOW QUALITY PROTEIN: ubiquitin-conjugating enzyme E2 J2-like [Microcebus murinus]|uniref:LOW QUALITY PROTEIN: ubiquitin-conjugating enzyme E2 J2-like n=1 Tax=Microcebus murinus TaxID=30608 RepID=UPI003F6D6778